MPVLDKQDATAVERYRKFVRSSPFASATQDPAWASVKTGWGDAQIYLEKDGEIAAAMSLLIKPVMRRWCMLYAPRGPVCDPTDTELLLALLREVDQYGKRRGSFLLRFDPELVYADAHCSLFEQLGFRIRGRGFGKDDLIQPRHNMILNLEGKTIEELMAGFSQKTRYNIRVAGRKGVTVRYGREPADLDAFYELFQITCIRDKIGGRTKDYFVRMLDAYGENCRIYLAEYEGQALSGAIAIGYGDKMWYSYGASSNELRNLMPNYLMQLEMIRWGVEQGRKFYDFGGVFDLNKENGLYKFKEGFCRQEGVTEYIGELDRVYKPVLYFAFTKMLPAWKRLRSGKSKENLSAQGN